MLHSCLLFRQEDEGPQYASLILKERETWWNAGGDIAHVKYRENSNVV